MFHFYPFTHKSVLHAQANHLKTSHFVAFFNQIFIEVFTPNAVIIIEICRFCIITGSECPLPKIPSSLTPMPFAMFSPLVSLQHLQQSHRHSPLLLG
nr:hypothetical protein [Helicobacter cinaedi]